VKLEKAVGEVEKSAVGKFPFKLESNERSWKVSSEAGKLPCSWKILTENGDLNELGKMSLKLEIYYIIDDFSTSTVTFQLQLYFATRARLEPLELSNFIISNLISNYFQLTLQLAIALSK